MDVVRLVVGGVLPYLAVPVFLVAMSYRVYAWVTLPSPAMTLFPAPATKGANARNTVKEALLFTSLFRGDRFLWTVAWGFHAVLALIFVGHVRVIADVDSVLVSVGMSEQGIQVMSAGVGGTAGAVIFVAAVVLLVRRIVVPHVREITSVADHAALVLIGAILITGNVMRFGPEHFDLGLTREYFAALATFGSAGTAPVLENTVFLLHMGFALVLLMYIPFSKILHFGGIFFTHQLIRKN